MKGRPRKPITELQLMGGFRPARHAKRINEPQFDGKPIKPRGMDKESSRLWDAVVPQLLARRVVTEIDSAILTSMCQLWSLYLSAVKAATSDPTSKEARGAVTGYWSAFDRAASHCGLNPVDRARLSAPPADDQDSIESFSRKRA